MAQQAIDAISTTVESIDRRIIWLQAEIKLLQLQRGSQTARIIALQKNPALVLGIQRLPVELLCIIFIYATEHWCYPFTDSFPSLSRQHILTHNSGPLRLTHVCRQWQQVAVNATSLWSSIAIDFDQISLSSLCGATEILRAYLERSRNHPLKILLLSLLTTFMAYLSYCSLQHQGGDVPTFAYTKPPFSH